jgi:hypothetical protein
MLKELDDLRHGGGFRSRSAALESLLRRGLNLNSRPSEKPGKSVEQMKNERLLLRADIRMRDREHERGLAKIREEGRMQRLQMQIEAASGRARDGRMATLSQPRGQQRAQ